MKFIANLDGNVLCPYQIILDIAEQLPNVHPAVHALPFMPICDLNATNDWINLESLGQPVAIRAKQLSDIISSALRQNGVDELVLEIHLGAQIITSDNVYCLLYLAQTLHTLSISINSPSEHCTYLNEKLAPLMSQDNIIIKFGKNDSDTNSETLIKLRNTRAKALKNLGFTLDDSSFEVELASESTINQVIGFAWICLKSGGQELACHLLEIAQSKAGSNPGTQEQLFMYILLIRFFSHQYAQIALSNFPETFTTLEQSNISTLQFLAAYSATLSRNLSVAERFFKQCNINKDLPILDEQSLFQLNLYALSRVLNGEVDTAFDLEFRIKDFIKVHNITTVGLRYVNFINIARLYKKTKRYDLSLEFYQKAYNEIDQGAYATSDHIYYNMNIGSLYESAGNYELALHYWVKSALHWLACNNQYELSWRPRLILCRETISDISKPLPIDKANQFLFDKITTLMQTCNLPATPIESDGFYFVEDSAKIVKEACFIDKNIIIYTTSDTVNQPRRHVSDSEKSLSNLLMQHLNTKMDIPHGQAGFVIDIHRDTNTIQSKEEALAYARLYHCNACWYEGEWLSYDLNEIHGHDMSLSLSKSISSIMPTEHGLALSYQRSFLNKTLKDPQEIELVKQLQEGQILPMSELSPQSKNLAIQLANKRVLRFSYPQ